MFSEYDDLVVIEAYNRYITIDPVNRALGWETHDPAQCMVEWPLRRNKRTRWVDYVLFDPDEQQVVLIETKGSGKITGKAVSQLAEYSRGLNSGVAVLTSGAVWQIYDLNSRGSFRSKLVTELNIYGDNSKETSEMLDSWLRKSNWW